MLPEVTRLWLNRYDVQVTIARLFQNVNLRILDSVALEVGGEVWICWVKKGKLRKKQNGDKIKSNVGTCLLRPGDYVQASKVDGDDQA